MKQKALILSGCIAATVPSVSIADVFPDNLVGLNLGEIRASSFLNQPFKGVIPFLFTSYENSKALSVRLAPASVFNQIGAEKYPILNHLTFQVTLQDNKPVILISSDRPINLPFLNFVLEISGPEGIVYQDYTVLLDPESKQSSQVGVEYFDEYQSSGTIKENTAVESVSQSSNSIDPIIDSALLANLSSRTTAVSNQNLKYRVKAGDSLSKIVQRQNVHGASLKTLSRIIFQKNPKAFIRGNANRLKKGVVLKLPTVSEINGFKVARKSTKTNKIVVSKKKQSINKTTSAQTKNKNIRQDAGAKTYKVVKGDSLSKITKRFGNKDISFTKQMNEIFTQNPDAFIKQSKNKIKAGAEILIPSVGEIQAVAKESSKIPATAEMKTNDSVEVELDAQESVISDIGTEKVEKKAKQVVLKENQYRIKAGDRLANLANDLGHQGIPFPNMMKAIYNYNPDAFIGGNMAKLVTGAIITIPPRSYFSKSPSQRKKVIENNKAKVAANTKLTTVSKSNKTSGQDLIKRIRELRKQLSQAKQELSSMKQRLGDKELLLNQKNLQLESLNVALMKLNGKADSAFVPVKVTKKINELKSERPRLNENTYQPKSKAEIAKLKRDLLNRKTHTNTQLENEKNKVLVANNLGVTESNSKIKNYPVATFFESKSNLAYSSLALLLGLLLIRYRRQLYSYTYSKISYDHPNYYPAPEVGSYDLKERNINFSDPKEDEAKVDYEFLSENQTHPESEELHENSQESQSEQVSSTATPIINPLLVEAKEDIFATNPDSSSGVTNKKESTEIEHCENLVTELLNDLAEDENIQDNSEWQDIENVCDNYLEKLKQIEGSSAPAPTKEENNSVIEGVAGFNHMMSDLLDSLDTEEQSPQIEKSNDDSAIKLIENLDEKQIK